jgi:hypothetical protein
MPVLSYAQSALPYNDAIKFVVDDLKESSIMPADIIAIVSFESATSQFTNKVIDDLIKELLKRRTRVVDRQNLEKIHAEQNYQSSSSYVDDDSAVSIGHELGAAAIIVGTGKNMIDYYRFNFRMLSVETAEILMQSSVNVRYDSTMRRLLTDQAYNSGGIGNTHFLIGARLGAGFEINTADEDMVGSGYSPKEKSNIAFNATLFGAFKFNESWTIQPEVIFMFNNGMEISGQGYTVTIEYHTLDIPLLVRWNFVLEPVLAGIVLGPYISLPIGKLNLSVGDQGSALDTTGYTFGATGGFVIGKKIGPGYITGDVRFLHDFSSLKVREDFGDGMQDANIGIRRSINLTIGYEFSL